MSKTSITKAEKEAERDRVYERAGGRCELRGEDGNPLVKEHWWGIIPKEGDTPWNHGHLVHLHSKRPTFWSETQGNTLLWGCPPCHLDGMNRLGLKPLIPERKKA